MITFDDFKGYYPGEPTLKAFLTTLLFTSFYFMPLFYSAFNILYLLKIFAFYLLFLVTYFVTAISKPKYLIFSLLLMLLIVNTIALFYSGANSLYCFITVIGGIYFRKSIAALVLSAVLISIAVLHNLLYQDALYFAISAAITSFALTFIGIFNRQDLMNIYRREEDARKMSALATIAERERIARDLHDILGHTLLSISLKSQLSSKLLAKSKYAAAAREITEVNKISDQALEQVRQAITGYKQHGISAQLKCLQKKLQENNFTVAINTNDTHLNATTESELILILTEATSNILRHSRGQFVRITLEEEAEHLCLTIYDDGLEHSEHLGNGLKGIHERIQHLDGTIKIDTHHGFNIMITIPVEQKT